MMRCWLWIVVGAVAFPTLLVGIVYAWMSVEGYFKRHPAAAGIFALFIAALVGGMLAFCMCQP